MSKSVKLTHAQWNAIRQQIKQENVPSVLLSRNKMKKVLGFTDRTSVCRDIIHLDFFSEKKKTFFFMKYSEVLNSEK